MEKEDIRLHRPTVARDIFFSGIVASLWGNPLPTDVKFQIAVAFIWIRGAE